MSITESNKNDIQSIIVIYFEVQLFLFVVAIVITCPGAKTPSYATADMNFRF
jgi:hypothetical protein